MAELTNPSAEIAARWSLARSTLSRDAVADPKRRLSVEVGDAKQAAGFYPQAKLLSWDNEVNLSVRLADADHLGGTVRTVGDKIEWARAGRIARLYEMPADGGWEREDGGLEFEVELAAPPSSNVLAFTVETRGLLFFRQGTIAEDVAAGRLSEAEAEGATRPDNVVGSYAVFHATRRGNYRRGKHYRAGKAFHIYRPHSVDANGAETWCDLAIDVAAKTLTVTVPQAWLDAAVYPIVIDPTFGYTSVGASDTSGSGEGMFGAPGTPASDGTVDTMHCYCRHATTSAQMGLYLSGGASNPTDLIANQSDTLAVGSATAWKDFVFTGAGSGPSVTGSTAYFVSLFKDGTLTFNFDSGGGADFFHNGLTGFPTWPDPKTGESPSTANRSMYASYVEAGGGTTPKGVFGGRVLRGPFGGPFG